MKAPRLFLAYLSVALLTLLPATARAAGASPMLAYVQDGAVWVKPLPSGQPQQITRPMEARQPQWSADGRWLSFRSRGQLWVISSSGNEPLQLYGGDDIAAAAWSPANDRLSFSAPKYGLAQFSPQDPGDPSAGWKQDLWLAYGSAPVWSPDGQSLAFVGAAPAAVGKAAGADSAQLVRIDRGVLVDVGRPIPSGMSLAGWPTGGKLLTNRTYRSLAAVGTALQARDARTGEPQDVSGPVLGYRDFVSASP
ncbi:MAG: PD40 domain-containing protein, partial [Chloroflexota bacterium]|nr:PD40 domain-containing protein [Chloroflexota bacterium]